MTATDVTVGQNVTTPGTDANTITANNAWGETKQKITR